MSAALQFPAGGVPDCPPQIPDALDTRENILRLEDACREMPQIDCPLAHHYAPGLYAREIFIPAGTIVVGKIHKHAHINVISHGSAIVVTEFDRVRVVAPYTFVSQPGTKRSLIAETDLVWTTIHTNEDECRDLEAIESRLIAPDYAAIGIEGQPATVLEFKQ
jgi:hypothetical protein